jgi:hypothetical protein
MLLTYIKPSKEAVELSQALGISFDVQSLAANGLTGSISDLASKVGLYEIVETHADAAIKQKIATIDAEILALDKQKAALGTATKANKDQRDAINKSTEALRIQKRELTAAKDANIDYNVVMADMSKRSGIAVEQLAVLFPNVRALKAALSLTRGEGAAFAADLEAIANASGATAAQTIR